MASNPRVDFRRLSVAERLELVEEIWDSSAADADGDILPGVRPARLLENLHLVGRRSAASGLPVRRAHHASLRLPDHSPDEGKVQRRQTDLKCGFG